MFSCEQGVGCTKGGIGGTVNVCCFCLYFHALRPSLQECGFDISTSTLPNIRTANHNIEDEDMIIEGK